MFRKRLRVRTGCARCKLRRIKCDELRPICSGCRRWGFACEWPQPESHRCFDRDHRTLLNTRLGFKEDHEVSKELPLNRVAPTRILAVSNGYTPFQSQTQFISTMTAVPLTLYSVRPEVVKRFRDLSIVNTVAVQEDWVRDAMAAFSKLVTSRGQDHPSQEAIEYYTKGCVALRNRVIRAPGAHSEVGLPELIASIYLALFEATGSGYPLAALIHFTAAAYFLGKLTHSKNQDTAFIKIAAEFSLYYISCLSLLTSGYDEALARLDMSAFTRVLVPPAGSTLLPYETSPYMSGNHDIHLLVLQITLFARSKPSGKTRLIKTMQWREQLQQMEVDCIKYYEGLPPPIILMLSKKTQLYIQALQIMLIKIGHRAARATDTSIQVHLKAGIETLSEITLSNHAAAVLCWPLLILLCAATSATSVQILDAKLTSILSILDPGHKSWQAAAVDQIKQRRILSKLQTEGQDEVDLFPDTLDLLVQPNGLLGQR